MYRYKIVIASFLLLLFSNVSAQSTDTTQNKQAESSEMTKKADKKKARKKSDNKKDMTSDMSNQKPKKKKKAKKESDDKKDMESDMSNKQPMEEKKEGSDDKKGMTPGKEKKKNSGGKKNMTSDTSNEKPKKNKKAKKKYDDVEEIMSEMSDEKPKKGKNAEDIEDVMSDEKRKEKKANYDDVEEIMSEMSDEKPKKKKKTNTSTEDAQKLMSSDEKPKKKKKAKTSADDVQKVMSDEKPKKKKKIKASTDGTEEVMSSDKKPKKKKKAKASTDDAKAVMPSDAKPNKGKKQNSDDTEIIPDIFNRNARENRSEESDTASVEKNKQMSLQIGALGGLNLLNASAQEDGDFKYQFGGLWGGSVILNNIPSISQDLSLKADLFVNMSSIDEDNYDINITTYNLSLMGGYKLTDALNVFLGPNFVLGFLDDDDKPLLGAKAEVQYQLGKVYLGLNYVGIPKQYNLASNGSSVRQENNLSSIVSLTVTYPIFDLDFKCKQKSTKVEKSEGQE